MIDQLNALFDRMEPLTETKKAKTAATVGVLFGGIGLWIYLRSFVDFMLLMVLAVPLIMLLGEFGWVIGAPFAGVYGYFRVVASNEALQRTSAGALR